MEDELKKAQEWAEHMPSEGENPQHAEAQRTQEGLAEKVRSPQSQEAAGEAPSQANPQAAEKNREFVEDVAGRYNEAEREFVEETPKRVEEAERDIVKRDRRE